MNRHQEAEADCLVYVIDRTESMLGPFCESPIELLMLRGFIALRLFDRSIKFAESWTGNLFGPIETEWSATIYPQHVVDTYRLDFAVEVTAAAKGRSMSAWIAVECDGHDFHEKTRQQAARDKARDRAITAAGFHILRFTGSEIYANHVNCAMEVRELAYRLYLDWYGQ